jgi:signal transduction histidine kinase
MKPLQPPGSAPAAAQAPSPSSLEPLLESLEAALGRIERARDEREREASVREARTALGQVRERIGDDGDLAALSAFLQSRGERDKSSLARELHDQLGGILTPAKMDLAWLRARLGDDAQYATRMARLDALIDQAIDLKRRIIEKLRPSLLDHLGLAAALKWYVEEQSAKAGIEPHLAIDTGLGRLPPEIEIAAFRLAQEAVDNAVRHSRASHIDLTVERANPGLHMTISDDGIGIGDVGAAKRMSRGLAAMHHRVRSLGGALEVHSPSGTGTRIEISIPLDSSGANSRS